MILKLFSFALRLVVAKFDSFLLLTITMADDSYQSYKISFGETWHKGAIFWGKRNWNSHIQTLAFTMSLEYSQDPKKFNFALSDM